MPPAGSVTGRRADHPQPARRPPAPPPIAGPEEDNEVPWHPLNGLTTPLLRNLILYGPSGTGKTRSALMIAEALTNEERPSSAVRAPGPWIYHTPDAPYPRRG